MDKTIVNPNLYDHVSPFISEHRPQSLLAVSTISVKEVVISVISVEGFACLRDGVNTHGYSFASLNWASITSGVRGSEVSNTWITAGRLTPVT